MPGLVCAAQAPVGAKGLTFDEGTFLGIIHLAASHSAVELAELAWRLMLAALQGSPSLYPSLLSVLSSWLLSAPVPVLPVGIDWSHDLQVIGATLIVISPV